ncbi:MAG TPA: hypothetical protein VMR45_02850 [Patescibacteria group bacterium]|nr:hypothetical protein [Patescibacteria group bacterium]
MTHYVYLKLLAQAYGEGNYSDCIYNNTKSCTSSGGSQSILANTGLMIAIIVTLACLLIFMALIVRYYRRRSKVTSAERNKTVKKD